MRFFILALLAPALAAQAPQPDSIRAAMEQSLARQRESIRLQAKQAKPIEASWYTVPWPKQDWPLPVPPTPAMDGGSASAGWRAHCDPMPPAQVEPLIRDAAAREGIESGLLRAVLERESAYYPCATSSKGAQGLMQLMPATAAGLGVADPFDPAENINAGAKLLASLLARYSGDVKLALAAYNAGSARVEDYKGVPPFKETRDYIGAILGSLSGAAQ